jgi:hypothetical protein
MGGNSRRERERLEMRPGSEGLDERDTRDEVSDCHAVLFLFHPRIPHFPGKRYIFRYC